MITLFQITGSSSFAARAALEVAGARYEVVNVHPRRREEAPGFRETNPLMRVPALHEGDVRVYETGAVLLWIAERFPEAGLAPAPGTPAHTAHLRWVVWLANTLHPSWWPVMVPRLIADDEAAWPSIRARGLEAIAGHGAYIESQLRGREWLAGDAMGVSDIYLYMLLGWVNYEEDLTLGGPLLAAHHVRVGATPGVTRARALDDLDERLMRLHSDLRAGQPLSG